MLDFQSCKWVVVLDHHYISLQTCEDHSSSEKKSNEIDIMSTGLVFDLQKNVIDDH